MLVHDAVVLSCPLTDASDKYLLAYPGEQHATLMRLQTEFELGEDFFLVLDEAQRAIDALCGCFCSADGERHRPVLRPIVMAWQEATVGRNHSEWLR